MNYVILITLETHTASYLAHREKNTFYYDHVGPIGCSTINVGNKRLLSYKKIK